MTLCIRPSVAHLIEPEYRSLGNLPSIKAAIDRADAVLIPYLSAGAVFIEVPSEDLCAPGQTLVDSAVLFSLLPQGFATLPTHRDDGALVYDDAFSVITAAAKRASRSAAAVCRVNLAQFRAVAARAKSAPSAKAWPTWA